MRRFLLSVPMLALLVAPYQSARGDELTFGSPAPEFKVEKYLRGAPLPELAKGKIRVVEFSGTTCLPCIKLIPEMNKLQETHPELEFVCIFEEREEEVRKFLEGSGKPMSIRVALDTKRHMQKQWATAAGANGIPLVFVVDKASKIAWIGYPGRGELPAVLQKVIAGTNDVRMDRIRWELDEILEKRKSQSVDGYNSASRKAHRCKSPAEAIAFIDQALPSFVGMPEFIGLLGLKLTFLRQLPNSRQQAYDHAITMAVAARQEKNPFHYNATCGEMLYHFQHALPENKDERLVDLALLLLQDESVRQNHIKLSEDQSIDWQIDLLETLAWPIGCVGTSPWRSPRWSRPSKKRRLAIRRGSPTGGCSLNSRC